MKSPIIFEDNQEKKDMNLRVIRRTYHEHDVIDYSAVLPCCSVYQTNNNEWQKCDIFGPLFILSAKDINLPILYILNTVSFDNPENFQLIFDPTTLNVCIEEKKVFFENNNTTQKYCISAYSNDDAQTLYNIISKTYNYSHDPTFKHLLYRFPRQ
ncbi:hypothetical protein M9Y10_009819 [Tritrichomonas musculus]|uniref:Uncharacterized protein n=1 Tax=Tritrichomonas musculus TaxID=1915356 RepID=A0ABR2IQW9_9EUKA